MIAFFSSYLILDLFLKQNKEKELFQLNMTAQEKSQHNLKEIQPTKVIIDHGI
jgi:hypothetical protein